MFVQMLTPSGIAKVDSWFRLATPEERTEAMDVIRAMHRCVRAATVNPLALAKLMGAV